MPKTPHLAPGDCFVHVLDGIAIYGEVLDPAAMITDSSQDPGVIEAIQHDVDRYSGDEVRLIRGHSAACPEGEVGEMELIVMIPIPREIYDRAREREWPCGASFLRGILRFKERSLI